MKPKATLKKISEQLGISVSTVSRALQNHPDISENTKRKVKELAELMEYEPNEFAINLRKNNSRLFCIMVPSTNHFYHSFINAVEEDAKSNGYSLMILQSGDDRDNEIANLKFCRQNRVAGIFVSTTFAAADIDHFLKMDELDVPVVFFDKVPNYEACNKVCVADAASANMAALLLANRKKKKILAIFGSKELSITQKRLESFTTTLQKEYPSADITTGFASSSDEARELVKQHYLKQKKFDAVFCMSDEILTGVMKTIQELALQIPKDISVIAISNGFFPQLYHPEISYVETSGYKLGKLAFARMMACINGSTGVEEIILESFFVQGGSL